MFTDFWAFCARCMECKWISARTIGGAIRKRTVNCRCTSHG